MLKNKKAILYSVILSALIAIFANAPQIDLYNSRGENWNGIYAIFDFDEPFYAAYLNSIIEGKPRRNSPYTGEIDTAETPQKESYLSIQFLATYPTALIARLFGLSLTSVMIMLTTVVAFLSTFILFQLFYRYFDDAISACTGTLLTLFGGNLAAGQGGFYGLFTNDPHYYHTLIFLRRVLPATAFPALILFFIFVWIFISSKTEKEKLCWGFLSALCFSYLVFSYFYFWTTVVAWLFGLGFIWLFCNRQSLFENKKNLLLLGMSFFVPLVFYALLLQNRLVDVDSSLALTNTRQPDLWRIPEIISYITIAIYLIAHRQEWIDLRENKFIFAFSLALTAPIVFNQQILTGHVLQSFHYQFTCVNHTSIISLILICLTLIKLFLKMDRHYLVELVLVAIILMVGALDMLWGISSYRNLNIERDKFLPVAERIKHISLSENITSDANILVFDFFQDGWSDGIDIPSITSHPVIWELHMSMFPDLNKKQYIERLFQSLYLQNVDSKDLKNKLGKDVFMTYAFFGAESTSDIYSGKRIEIKQEDKEKVIEDYQKFQQTFDHEHAKNLNLKFVLYKKEITPNLSTIEKWFNVNEEKIDDYVLLSVTLKQP